MYHDVFVSRLRVPDSGPLTEEQSASFRHLTGGNCPRAVAVDCARNAVRFGPGRSARVFAGRRMGRLVYEVVADPDENEAKE